MPEFELLCCIVNHRKGSRVLKEAKAHGIKGGTVFIGKGTAKSRILDVLDLNDSRKEIVWMAAPKEVAFSAAEAIAKEMNFHKKDHGIGIAVSLSGFIGTGNLCYNPKTDETERGTMHNAVFTIVDKGKGEDVADAAYQAGAKGATIWNARGSGIHETEVLFAMPVEPEREIVMIVAENEITEMIVAVIRQKLKIDEPGNGIVFVLPVEQIYGLL